MYFYQTEVYVRRSQLTDEEQSTLEEFLSTNPGAGALVRGGGGIRKVRAKKKKLSKRNSPRVIYYWIVDGETIWFLDCYSKNEKESLTADDIQSLKTVAKLLKTVPQPVRR